MSKVPKIIHQLWIGEKSPPMNAMNSVKKMNPDFEYWFWNEEKLKKDLPLEKDYLKKIRQHTPIWGRADLYRWQILKKYGGVFVDADMVSIEPIDEFLLNESFFCWENEITRPNLCATSIQGYHPNHPITNLAIDWILNNETRVEKSPQQSWELVGPGLLSRVYHQLLQDKSVVKVYPSYYFLPDHHTGVKYKGHIPLHHRKPKKEIDITISDDKKLVKEVMKGLKHLEGHFAINISCPIDITKYLKSMRNVNYIETLTFDINKKNDELIYYDEYDNIVNHHQCETTEQRLCEEYINENDIILELGARYGTVSCLTNRIVNDKENHYVVEPDSKVWDALEDNMKINNCSFNIIKGVIAPEDKKYKLAGTGYAVHTTTDTNYSDGKGIDTYKIPDVPFNTLIADCEGYMEIFYNENKEWFKTINKIIMECDMPQNCDYDYLIKELLSIGFKVEKHIVEFGLNFFVLIKK
jgi:hypothetical protein